VASSALRNLYPSDLPIAEVSRRTGISTETLRIWERRYGFPQPDRRPSGHRRYSEEDCRQIEEMLLRRRKGLPLTEAIAATRRPDTWTGGFLLDELQARRPHLEAALLSRRAMLAVSRSIEYEAATQASGGLLLGAFQRRAAWDDARGRWETLATRIQPAIVVADFERVERCNGVWQVPIPPRSPLHEQWTVVCDSPRWSACLIAREHDTLVRGRRAFRAVWSVEPEVVRDAARLSLASVEGLPPAPLEAASAWVRRVAVRRPRALAQATRLTNRIVTALG